MLWHDLHWNRTSGATVTVVHENDLLRSAEPMSPSVLIHSNSSTDMHIQGAHNAALRYLHAAVQGLHAPPCFKLIMTPSVDGTLHIPNHKLPARRPSHLDATSRPYSDHYRTPDAGHIQAIDTSAFI